MTLRLRKIRWNTLFLILLFCFSISLFNLAGYFFAATAFILLLFNVKRITVSTPELVLFIYSSVYYLYYTMYRGLSIEYFIIFMVGPCAAYLIGKLYMQNMTADDNSFMVFIVVIATGMFCHGALNVYAYVHSEHYALYEFYRQSVDFWRGGVVNVKTTEMFFTFASGISIGTLFSKTKLKFKVLALAVLIASLSITIFFANRTLILICLVILIWQFFVSKIPRQTKLLITILVAGIVFLFFALANYTALGEDLAALKIIKRITEGEASSRFDVWWNFFEDNKFLRYPFGGAFIVKGTGLNYLHNMWLDIYNTVGFIPFIAFIVFTIMMFKEFRVYRVVMLDAGKDTEYTIFKCLMLAVIFNCMVEPIIEANPYYFLSVLMFLGAMNERKKIIKSL